MIEAFIKEYAKLIANYPEKISTSLNKIGDDIVEIVVSADKTDTGKLIGKDGKMINAIKVFISGAQPESKINYKISVKAIDEARA